MAKNKWVFVAGVLLLAAIFAGSILFQQRNDAQRRWQESQDQISQLNQEIQFLNQTLQQQKDQLSIRADLLRKKQLELQTAHQQLQQAHGEMNMLRENLSSLEKKIDGFMAERNQLLENHQSLTMRLKEQATILNQRLTDLESEIQILQAELADQDKKLAESKESYGALQSEAEHLRKDLSDTKESAGMLEAHRKSMKEAHEALVSGLKKQLDSKEASIEEYREKLKVTFVDRILFGFSQIRISPEGKDALSRLADILATVPKGMISIVGHSDNIPIAQEYRYRFASNWELSSARAAAVARYLLEHGDLDPSKIEVIGRSQYQPLAKNDSKTGRAQNRRVEIIIKPDLSPHE